MKFSLTTELGIAPEWITGKTRFFGMEVKIFINLDIIDFNERVLRKRYIIFIVV
jgi:hypothetical protein